MQYNLNKIALQFNGKYSSGYEYLPAEKNALPVILLCHGNYKEGKDAKIMLALAERFAVNGFVVLSLDNLCYNQAWRPDDGEIHSPEEIDLRWVACSAITYIKTNYHDKKIIIVGHSMGAAIALSVGALNNYVNKIIAISPTRISAFISDDNKLYDFWKDSNNIEINMDMDTLRFIRFDIMVENYLSLLSRKKTLLICGHKERYLGYKEWMKSVAEAIGDDLSIISNADHFFGTYENKKNPDVFDDLMENILNWIRQTL